MAEDRLSPDLGRLIDRAKVAVGLLGTESVEAEGVALLVESGDIYSGATDDRSGQGGEAGAVRRAQKQAEAAGPSEVLAAAVAAPFDQSETVLPSAESHRLLAEIDPELPLIVKKHGRWVMLPASQVGPGS